MNNLKDIILESTSIAITCHVDPDGDAIGSILGLYLALKQVSDKVEVFTDEKLPTRYDFLPQSNAIKSYEDIKDKEFDLFFALDCGNDKRVGRNLEVMKKSKTLVNVDHHISNTKFGDINILDLGASSTCEIVYNLIKDLGLVIDKNVATCLYAGIITDTGNFMYDNAGYKTYLAAADLINTNIDKQEIVYNFYQKKSINNLRFLGYCLSNVDIRYDGRLAIFEISTALLDEFTVPKDDIEGVVNHGRDIDSVEISVSIREVDKERVKLSFRSKHDGVNVSALACLFGGGGHKKAAGAAVNMTLDEAKAQVIEKSKQFLRW